jgi:ribosome maturation factor RimP
MAKSSISDIVRSIALPIVEEAGCELVDVEFVKEGGNWFLRVYIDKPGGVSLEDCERVSQPLNQKIDETDPIPHAYYMEVSSPGLERTLKTPRDFEKAMGQLVEIKLFKAVDGTKRYEGQLDSYDGKQISVKLESGEIKTFQTEQVGKVKTIVKF